MLLAMFSFAVMATAIGDVRFDSDDRFDSRIVAAVVELYSPVHVAMIGQCECLHPLILGDPDHRGDGHDTVQKAVVAMDMKMAISTRYLCQDSSGCSDSTSCFQHSVTAVPVVGARAGTGKGHGDWKRGRLDARAT